MGGIQPNQKRIRTIGEKELETILKMKKKATLTNGLKDMKIDDDEMTVTNYKSQEKEENDSPSLKIE